MTRFARNAVYPLIAYEPNYLLGKNIWCFVSVLKVTKLILYLKTLLHARSRRIGNAHKLRNTRDIRVAPQSVSKTKEKSTSSRTKL